jgi:hypothetical protein
MTHLWFVENRLQAKWMRNNKQKVVNGTVIALTAEALQGLEEFDVTHTAVSDYADTRPVAAAHQQLVADFLDMLKEVETYILSHHDGDRITDAGFLTSNFYWMQYVLTILMTRAHLLQETIRACSPVTVSLFKVEEESDYTLKTSHIWYPSLVMRSLLQQLASKYNFQLDIRSYKFDGLHRTNKYLLNSFLHRIPRIPGRLKRMIVQYIAHLRSFNLGGAQNTSTDDRNLVLMVGGLNHEWRAITSHLRDTQGYILNWIDNTKLSSDSGHNGWCMGYDSKLGHFGHQSSIKLKFDPYNLDREEVDSVTVLCDGWANKSNRNSKVSFRGLDLADDLFDIVKTIAAGSLSLCRYLDYVVSHTLDAISPDVVCFQGVVHMADKRMASACKERGIPTVGIQHGGSVGTHMSHSVDMNDWSYCDYYLTYGAGIKVNPDPILPQQASLVSVGSTDIDQRIRVGFIQNQIDNNCIKVLWISEKSFGNTIGHRNRGEDTKRYLLQQRCLSILNNSDDVEVIFRPFKDNEETIGTVRWIDEDPFIAIKVDINSTLDELLETSDVIITDNYASTVWNEAIAFGKPLILFCDPQQTLLMPHFAADLDKACLWCKTESEFMSAVQRLSNSGPELLSDLRQTDTSAYLENYVLYRNDGKSKQRAAEFFEALCVDRKSVDKQSISLQDSM